MCAGQITTTGILASGRGLKNVKLGQKWDKWDKMGQNETKWAKNGTKWDKMGQKWDKNGEISLRLPRL